MHYISLWEMAEIGHLINKRVRVRPELRGYRMQPVPPDRRPQMLPIPQSLSVSDLAKTLCSTHRDIYFAKVERIRTNPQDRPWVAEAGKIIHSLLQAIYQHAMVSLPNQGTALNPERLLRRLKTFGTRQKNELLVDYQNDQRFAGRVWDELNNHLDNIIFFEALLICSLVAYKLSRKTVLATGVNIDPSQEFRGLFDFSAIEQPLSASLLGLSEAVTPDFLFGRNVIGDIKTGHIHQDTFEVTCTAYALAYEAEYRRNINHGIILHVGFSRDYALPIYQGSQLIKIDDEARTRFLLLREQKLDVLVRRADPGRQNDQLRCRPCPFYNRCW